MMTDILIRSATATDVEALAQAHIQAWDETYRGIAPQEVFDSLNLAARQRLWTSAFAGGSEWPIVLVAEDRGRVAGFVSASPAADSIIHPRIMIRTLYVLKAWQRQGLGCRLLGAMAERLMERGISGIGLGVLDENRGAIAFYEALGGQYFGEEISPGPVWKTREILFVWDDLPALLEKCP